MSVRVAGALGGTSGTTELVDQYGATGGSSGVVAR